MCRETEGVQGGTEGEIGRGERERGEGEEKEIKKYIYTHMDGPKSNKNGLFAQRSRARKG
jgi:hypothetical protein